MQDLDDLSDEPKQDKSPIKRKDSGADHDLKRRNTGAKEESPKKK